ncbi:MAG: hypothetical protein HPY57_13340 [Ignavibacteria bacterium]|nr:hypothetical protein [Ignavibacteria bacterium]
MKNYNNFIIEKIIRKENIDVIYNKYYKNIDYDIFKKLFHQIQHLG